ncbi:MULTISPECIES: hypothetical protein [unclassified Rathayibacter]|uniref:hypothetical protein n=1 Tax=unclassified Rathayibacter TaxID=2609250 RepID=UPI000F4CB5B1|nr:MULTISPECIES: hypothetical protein [unclassified Rathayibacter]ROP44408.1 hypothetical protein EDF45_3874 [Rathayibacter sp. PhB186]ROS46924.1 hypothetical protein EDF44_3825 [Rathayibacter sp. PhB185]
MERARTVASTVAVGAIAFLASGCGPTEYRGYDSGIDGVLWRQIAAFEDPLSRELFSPRVNEPEPYLAALNGTRWDGEASTAAELDLDAGGVVLYDLSSTPTSATASVFIASGPRSPADDSTGPSEVYTCYRIEIAFSGDPMPSAGRVLLDGCPEPLVSLLAEDAAFASGEVFDG